MLRYFLIILLMVGSLGLKAQNIFDEFLQKINPEELFELTQNGQLGRFLELNQQEEEFISLNTFKSLDFINIKINPISITFDNPSIELIQQEYRHKENALLSAKTKLLGYMQEKFIFSLSLQNLSAAADLKYQKSETKYLKFFQAHWNEKEVREEPFKIAITSSDFERFKNKMGTINSISPHLKDIAKLDEVNELINIKSTLKDYFAKSWFKDIPSFVNRFKLKSSFAFCSEQSLAIFDFLQTLKNEKLLKNFSIVGRVVNHNYSTDNNHAAVLLKSTSGQFFVVDSWPLGGNQEPLIYTLKNWSESKNLLLSHLFLFNCNKAFSH